VTTSTSAPGACIVRVMLRFQSFSLGVFPLALFHFAVNLRHSEKYSHRVFHPRRFLYLAAFQSFHNTLAKRCYLWLKYVPLDSLLPPASRRFHFWVSTWTPPLTSPSQKRLLFPICLTFPSPLPAPPLRHFSPPHSFASADLAQLTFNLCPPPPRNGSSWKTSLIPSFILHRRVKKTLFFLAPLFSSPRPAPCAPPRSLGGLHLKSTPSSDRPAGCGITTLFLKPHSFNK